MDLRLNLDSKFREIVGSNVYFQPPETTKMSYPAIRYTLNDIPITYANNLSYKYRKEYHVILITKRPDNDMVAELLKLPKIRFERFYASDNLNHYMFTITT